MSRRLPHTHRDPLSAHLGLDDPIFPGHLFYGDDDRRRGVRMPAARPPEFRRRAVELARQGDLPIASSPRNSGAPSPGCDAG